MSAPLTYGIAAKAKNADCAAFFLNWVATNDDGPPDRCRPSAARTPAARPTAAIPPSAAGSVTNETLAAGAGRRQDNGAMDFIANATGLDLRPGLDARAPEDGRRQAGRCRPAQGRPGRVREGTRPVDVTPPTELAAESGDASSQLTRRPVGGAIRRILLDPGIRRQTLVGWLFVLPALSMYAVFVLLAARPDGPVLALPLGRRRPGDLGRA